MMRQAVIALVLLAACSGGDETTTARALLGSDRGGTTYGSNGSGSDAGAGSGSGRDGGPEDGPGDVDAGPDDAGPPDDGAIDGGDDGSIGGGSDGAIDGGAGDGDGGAGSGDGGAGNGDGGVGDGGAGDGGAGDGGSDGGADGGTADGGTDDAGAPEPDAGVDPDPTDPTDPTDPLDPDDICARLASGEVDDSEVDQETLDTCNGDAPADTSCTFSMVPAFFLGDQGCNVYDSDSGDDLGNFGVVCPSNIYDQQILCELARGAQGPLREQVGGDPWYPCFDGPCEDGFFSAAPEPVTDFFSFNTFQSTSTGNRRVVVLGSSMMSTHNQIANGPMCGASTVGDFQRPNFRGNDFTASPGWRVSWKQALALGRTGYASGDIISQPGADSCHHAWDGPFPPAKTGTEWLAAGGAVDKAMVTDGGLINDLKSRGGSWTDTLAAIVACNAMQDLEIPLNAFLDQLHKEENFNKNTVKEKGKSVTRRPPQVTFVRIAPPGKIWADALDLTGREARCLYRITPGNGFHGPLTKSAVEKLGQVDMIVPALIPLDAQVATNLTAIKQLYLDAGIKQIWLQYPRMEQAQVVLRGTDLKLLWNVVHSLLHDRWEAEVRLDAIDGALKPRIRKLSDDLNAYMFNAIGCAGYVVGHGPQVCARDGAGKPLVVVTESAYPLWRASDHQTTVKGGMPHESAAGADKLGAAINVADQLP